MKKDRDFDYMKFDKMPIPDTIEEIEEHIAVLKEVSSDSLLSPVEQQLIQERIVKCNNKMKDLVKPDTVKITPVLGTATIAETKRRGKRNYSINDGSAVITLK